MPEPKIARGNVLRGSRTSSLMAEHNSNPANANAICGQKFTVPKFQTGSMLDHVKCTCGPLVRHVYTPRPTSISNGRYVHTPPAFCSHLPMFRPMIFSTTATNSREN